MAQGNPVGMAVGVCTGEDGPALCVCQVGMDKIVSLAVNQYIVTLWEGMAGFLDGLGKFVQGKIRGNDTNELAAFVVKGL